MAEEDPAAPPVAILVLADDVVVTRLLADTFRADLVAAGIGEGRHAFTVRFTPPLAPDRPHVVRVIAEETGEDCPGSPRMLPAATAFDATARQALAALIRTTADPAEIDARIGFLHGLIQDLRQDQVTAAQAGRDEQVRERRLGRAAEAGHRALMIDDHLPRTGHDAGANALISHALALGRLGYAVTIVGADMAPVPDAAALQAAGITLHHAPGWGSVEEVLRLEAGLYALVYLHRISTAWLYLPLVRHWMKRARVVYAVADLHHLRLTRQAEAEQRPEVMDVARRLRAREVMAAQAADAVITHSAVEAAMLRQVVPPGRVHVVPWSVAVTPGPAGFAARQGIGFIGDYAHAPNLNAAFWLVDEIMPALRAGDGIHTSRLDAGLLPSLGQGGDGGGFEKPTENKALLPDANPASGPETHPYPSLEGRGMKKLRSHGAMCESGSCAEDAAIDCHLIGPNLPDVLRQARDGVVPRGQVADLAGGLDALRLTVAPLAYGAGIKGKVIDSLAHGVPCVCSPVAAEGLDLPEPLASLVAADTPGLVRSILRLHGDAALWAACREAGLAWVAAQCSTARVDALLKAAVEGGITA